MKKTIILICALLSISAAAAQDPDWETSSLVKAGMKTPEFTAHMLDGTEIGSTDLRGKVVLLNFWATWCPPCRAEFTRVPTDIIERFEGKDFTFIALSRGEDRARVERFIKQNNYTFPVGLDSDSSVYDKFANNYIPRNFVIDKDGTVVMTTVGYDPEEFDRMIELIENLLK